MFAKHLEEIGLNDKEALIYLALLQVEHNSAINIAQNTKIDLETVSSTLDSLAKKGLVSEVILAKKTHYKAEPPERLETFFEHRKVELDEKGRRLKDLVPQLKSMQRKGSERPVVNFFEGKEGILSGTAAFSRYFSEEARKGENKEMHLIYPQDLLREVFSEDEITNLRQIRISNKVRAKALYTDSKGDSPDPELTTRLRLDEKKYPILCDIAVYKDLVRITGEKDYLYDLSIQNNDIATTLRSIINFVLDQYKK